MPDWRQPDWWQPEINVLTGSFGTSIFCTVMKRHGKLKKPVSAAQRSAGRVLTGRFGCTTVRRPRLTGRFGTSKFYTVMLDSEKTWQA